MTEPYRIRSPETWAAARLAYLDGDGADEVCARFDLGLSALRKRARLHGWRRGDRPDPEPADDAEDGDLPDMDDQTFADLAFRKMSVAARRGRLTQALGWARLRDMALWQAAAQRRLDAWNASAETAETPAIPAPTQPPASVPQPRETARAILTRARAEVQEVHDVHSNSPFEPGLNRAQRRSRLKALNKQTGPP